MERLVIKKKNEPGANGVTIVYDENNVGHELEIAQYPLETPLIKTERGWVFDVASSPFDAEKNERIKIREDYYFLTKDVLPYRIYQHMIEIYPQNCIKMWKRNPYEVLDIDESISFSAIDRNVTLSRFEHRLYEMKYAIKEVLRLNEASGHTYLEYDTFCSRLGNLLKRNGHPLESLSHIPAYLNYYKDMVYCKDGIIAFAKTEKMERFIWDAIAKMKGESRYSDFTKRLSATLSNEQCSAVNSIISGANIGVLTGGPGVGKTTTLQTLVTWFKEAYPSQNIALLAPTGKASRRIKEVFGDYPVTTHTIHYFLGLGHQRNREESERIKDADFIIIDESSMAGVELFYLLLSQISEGTKVLLVGDVDQLPSVEPGNILNDLIEMGVETSWLTQNFRSASTIHKNATKINNGESDLLKSSSFVMTPVPNEMLLDYAAKFSMDGKGEILTPYRKEANINGEIMYGSCNAINDKIHREKYPHSNGYVVGEPIVFNHTNYGSGYVNGDTGNIPRIDFEAVYVTLEDGKTVAVKNLDDISLSYAQTIHKTQGSEYPHIGICIPEGCSQFFSRQMLYTAVTRAKEGEELFGCLEEIPKIIANNTKLNKRTFLSLWAREREKEKKIEEEWER